MPDPNPVTIESLYQDLQLQDHQSPAHEALLRSIEALETASKPFRYFRGRKRLPLVNSRNREQLMELHRNIGTAAENLLAEDCSPALKEMVRKLSALSAERYRALLNYDPVKAPKLLDTIEMESRTLTLHVGADELKGNTLGANLSERVPLAFYDTKGNKINGVFTKKKTLEIAAPVFQAMRDSIEAQVQDPERKNDSLAALEALQNTLKMNGVQNFDGEEYNFDGTQETAAINLLKMATYRTEDAQTGKKTSCITGDRLSAVLQQLMKPEEFKKIDPAAFSSMAEKLEALRGPISINNGSAKIPPGGRLDNRNAAMSTVADLLGAPRLVCRSRPMKLVDANGVEQEGTFMELAQGLDLKNLDSTAQYVDNRSLDNAGRALRDIADLQVLDYICGNVDRHAANLAYQFNEFMEFNGVQGFDNDCSFGILVPEGKEGKNRMVGLDSMMAVSQRTYDRVQQLTPAVLKYALRGYGLSEEELNAAGERLAKLKTHLQAEKQYYEQKDRNRRNRPLEEGHVRILKDKDWNKYEPKEFCFSKERDEKGNPILLKNTFALTCTNVLKMRTRWKNQKKQFRDLTQTIAVGIGNRAVSSTPERELKTAKALSELLSKRTWSGFSSPQYREMQEAVKAYTDYQKQLQERLKQTNDESQIRKFNYHRQKEAVITPNDLERLRALSQTMKEKAETYLAHKKPDGQLPANASEYTKHRVEIAEQVLSYAEKGVKIRPEEAQQAAANLKNAGETVVERNSVIASEFVKTPKLPELDSSQPGQQLPVNPVIR